MDCNLPGYSVYRILQATILEWVATSFSRGIFPNGSNPCLLHWQVDSLPLNHQGSPLLIMEVLSIDWMKALCEIYESQISVPHWSTCFPCLKTVHVYTFSCSIVSYSFRPCGLQPARLLCPWDSPGKNTGVGCCFLLQGIFPTQGLNPRLLHLPHWQADALTLCHLGSPKTVQKV